MWGGLASDVEAGFRKDEDPEELAALAESVEANLACAKELSEILDATVSGLEDSYAAAVRTMAEDPASYDPDSVAAINRTSATTLSASEVTLESLAERVTVCETAIKDLQDRLGVLEEDIKGLKELLDMVQSVVFMSENTSDKIQAYYTLGPDIRDDGCMVRTKASTVTLNYLVRPAKAAEALADNALWNDGLKVVGYYAGEITKAVSLLEFTISNVVAAEDGSGLVTIDVENTLSEDFYFKETGAKMALSLVSGKTDLTSKFVEVVPVDDSGLTYVESLSLSTESFEVDEDLTYQIRAVLTPENVSDGTLTWTTSDEEIATVSSTGLVTGVKAGDAVITVTTNSLNEWGKKLTKTCEVKVMPNVKLVAPTSIEIGGTIDIQVESPEYIDPQYIKWESSDANRAPVDDNGKVTGSVLTYNDQTHTYDPVVITCTIGDYNPTILTHEVRVVAPQPKGLVIPGLGDSEGQKTIKIGDAFSLGGTITPESAALSYYRVFYQPSGGTGNDAVATIDYSTGDITTKGTPGSVTFMARIMDTEGTKYFYPAGNEVRRYVTVNVDPYWVESISVPATYKMTPGQTINLTPEFTSDVEGVSPTDQSYVWTSTNPDYVSVDAETGKITAIKEGTVELVVTTCGEWSVPDGEAHKSASCLVTVETPTDPYDVGYFYYKDGTWSETIQSGKEVIGVIFTTQSAAGDDVNLRNAYPECTHGLVVGLHESDVIYGYLGTSAAYTYWKNNSYGWTDTGLLNGYSNTAQIAEYGEYKGSELVYGAYYVQMLRNDSNGVAYKYNEATPVPEGITPWYIPSFAEMNLLAENMSTINSKLKEAGGSEIQSVDYWVSTLYYQGSGTNLFVYKFSTANSGWGASITAPYSTTGPVRVVLAF